MYSATALKSVSANFVIRFSEAAIALSGSLPAACKACKASTSPLDLGAGPFGAPCASRHMAPAPIARRPVRIIRFMRTLLQVPLLLFLRQFQALLRFLARLFGRTFQLKSAWKIFGAFFGVAGGNGRRPLFNRGPCLVTGSGLHLTC